ncbi:MAG TPA: type II toxin-antitoxin system VapC family toxin [Candidatus Nanoarchaeia archaeon]|nr:type II toxin-antitoxin system VapC family toxin [Candidatus Nanoarchaeia archaeon]
MEQKVCLDTDVVIAILNNEERAIKIIEKIENSLVFITTVTLFELLLRKTNLQAIEIFRNKVYMLGFNEDAARKASDIFKELQMKGRMTDIRDIFIASICIANNCSLSTFNKKHFEHINEINLI